MWTQVKAIGLAGFPALATVVFLAYYWSTLAQSRRESNSVKVVESDSSGTTFNGHPNMASNQVDDLPGQDAEEGRGRKKGGGRKDASPVKDLGGSLHQQSQQVYAHNIMGGSAGSVAKHKGLFSRVQVTRDMIAALHSTVVKMIDYPFLCGFTPGLWPIAEKLGTDVSAQLAQLGVPDSSACSSFSSAYSENDKTMLWSGFSTFMEGMLEKGYPGAGQEVSKSLRGVMALDQRLSQRQFLNLWSHLTTRHDPPSGKWLDGVAAYIRLDAYTTDRGELRAESLDGNVGWEKLKQYILRSQLEGRNAPDAKFEAYVDAIHVKLGNTNDHKISIEEFFFFTANYEIISNSAAVDYDYD